MDIKEMKETLEQSDRLRREVVRNLVDQVGEFGSALPSYQFPEFCTLIMGVLDEFEDDCDFANSGFFLETPIIDLLDEALSALVTASVHIPEGSNTSIKDHLDKAADLVRDIKQMVKEAEI